MMNIERRREPVNAERREGRSIELKLRMNDSNAEMPALYRGKNDELAVEK